MLLWAVLIAFTVTDPIYIMSLYCFTNLKVAISKETLVFYPGFNAIGPIYRLFTNVTGPIYNVPLTISAVGGKQRHSGKISGQKRTRDQIHCKLIELDLFLAYLPYFQSPFKMM